MMGFRQSVEERCTYLCIGGPLDGQLYVPPQSVRDGADRFKVRVDNTRVEMTPVGPDVSRAAVQYEDHTYMVEKLYTKARVGDGTICYVFWRYQGIDLIDTLTELFKGYKGKDQR